MTSMEALWFCVVALMLTMYAILDGFDLGAGVIHLFLARTESERRTVLGAAGPFWDGNEFCLLLAGASLYYAFPAVYASREFDFAAIVLVWLLLVRGVGVEFRNRSHNPGGRRVLDVTFGVGSILLALMLGAAAGFILHGTLDWFVVVCAISGLAVLTLQSATWMALQSTGQLQLRCRRLAAGAWWAVLLGYAVVTVSQSGGAAIHPGEHVSLHMRRDHPRRLDRHTSMHERRIRPGSIFRCDLCDRRHGSQCRSRGVSQTGLSHCRFRPVRNEHRRHLLYPGIRAGGRISSERAPPVQARNGSFANNIITGC